MRLLFDHAVVVVGDLAVAASRFRDAGFLVTPGGRHDALPTENAIVAFADGGYLELLAARDPDARAEWRALAGTERWESHLQGASAVARRFLPRLAGPDGVGDFVVRRDKLARFAAESRRRGFVMTGPVAMRRERRDGEVIAWELLLPADDTLPFLIEDRTPRDRRVPASPETLAHPNGASGVAELLVHSAAVATTALAYADLFELAPRSLPNGDARLEAGRVGIVLTPGGPAGARAVTLVGVTALPEEILALGVRASQA